MSRTLPPPAHKAFPLAPLRAAPAIVIALLLAPAPAAQAQERKPDFSGSYAFVQKRSDNLQEAIARAVGPDFTVGNKKSEQARVWIKRWLEDTTRDPDKRVLTIEQSAESFKSGMGDEVNIYYFGREATSEGPAGGNLKVTVAWKGDQLVTEEKQAKGKGRITAVYTLVPDGKTLLVAWRLEHESLLQPLDVRLAFERLAR